MNYYIYIMSIYAIETLSDVHSILIYMPCCMYVHDENYVCIITY